MQPVQPPPPAAQVGPYCTPAEMLDAHDWESVAAYCADGAGPRPSRASLLNGQGGAGSVLARALSAASGSVDAAALVGRRYSPTDLALLTGTARDYLARLTSHLALYALASRRQPAASSPENLPGVKDALAELERLRTGERVFAFADAADAGLPVAVIPPARQYPAVERARRLYGSHGQGGNGVTGRHSRRPGGGSDW